MRGDAIGEHTLEVHRLLKEMGFQSDIYLIAVGDGVPVATSSYLTYGNGRGSRRKPDTLLLYQASTGSPVADFLSGRSEPIAIDYHNITPSADFEAWDIRIAREMDRGREELARFARRAVHALADSTYNEEDLKSIGYRSTQVAPILFDTSRFDGPADPVTRDWLERDRSVGGTNVLFVGRVVPNKAHHQLVMAFAAYRRLFDPKARLYMVGSHPVPEYTRALRMMCLDLGIYDAVELSGFVTQEELTAYYGSADVFVCLSDHEGFCVPLLEAMHHRIPIVAYAAAAVPETLGQGGLLMRNKSPVDIAVAINRIVTDRGLALRLVAQAGARLKELSIENTRAAFRAGIERAVANAA